jgi:hypothetical protein
MSHEGPDFVVSINSTLVRGYFVRLSHHDPYVAVEGVRRDQALVIVNCSHPAWLKVTCTEAAGRFLRECVLDALVEWDASRRTAGVRATTFMAIKDRFLRGRFTIDIDERGLLPWIAQAHPERGATKSTRPGKDNEHQAKTINPRDRSRLQAPGVEQGARPEGARTSPRRDDRAAHRFRNGWCADCGIEASVAAAKGWMCEPEASNAGGASLTERKVNNKVHNELGRNHVFRQGWCSRCGVSADLAADLPCN